jgi:hypothetical protein
MASHGNYYLYWILTTTLPSPTHVKRQVHGQQDSSIFPCSQMCLVPPQSTPTTCPTQCLLHPYHQVSDRRPKGQHHYASIPLAVPDKIGRYHRTFLTPGRPPSRREDQTPNSCSRTLLQYVLDSTPQFHRQTACENQSQGLEACSEL